MEKILSITIEKHEDRFIDFVNQEGLSRRVKTLIYLEPPDEEVEKPPGEERVVLESADDGCFPGEEWLEQTNTAQSNAVNEKLASMKDLDEWNCKELHVLIEPMVKFQLYNEKERRME